MKRHPLAFALGISMAMVAVFATIIWMMDGGEDGFSLPRAGKSGSLFGDKVGVVLLTGVIEDPTKVLQALDSFQRNQRVKAILFRVDSPGGGVAPSQEIYREIMRVRQSKPVVCSMGSTAASGGYYVAAACSKIMASPGTVTGSIGVISMLPNLQNLFDKLGLELQIVKAGSMKDAGGLSRALTPAERAMLQALSDDCHQQFISDIAKARGMREDLVRALADGRIFTGRMAKQLGLVDELGNLRDAVLLAAQLGKIEGRPELVLSPGDDEPWLVRFLREESRLAIKSLLHELGGLRLEYRLALPALD